MSPSREPPPSAVPGPSVRESQGLLRKYRELMKKHTALVRKLGEHTRRQVITFKLSRWALETNDSALAVMNTTSVVLANSRWHVLGRLRGPWRREEDGAERMALRDVGQAEAAAVLALTEGARITRYRQVRESQPRVLEVRAERVTGHMQGQVLVLARDVTEQARAEEELASARATLLEREKVRALGELAAGIAHDLRSTLDAMRLRLELLQRDVDPAGQGQQHLDALARVVSDAEARVDRLQDFSRRKPGTVLERVQLMDVVRDAVDIVRGGIEHHARQGGHPLRLDVELPEGLPHVCGSAMELRYVIINLIINARDAMPRGGAIRVKAFRFGRAVRLTVEDEGTGIPEEHLPNIFKPFFTTKGDKGTGLGLSMAHGVVTQAGGTLTAANRPEGGAVFTLTFPALKAAPAPARGGAR
ncbi:sporulation kinase A [Corallococcus coralloides DSM 2259]|uniref:histidine kinase n=1 Tax=Corallococcus coralloides (strain ATCC 25202 / DSM 2259 / NBRC 100086 / M2) TaxID=1144275 RepID=H8MFY2_CORCM|nr:ATP-binding protein [Corallococcus coralloides]AFE09172.1 sporulation kinase A [Corallococcus coralloides DSM 2259]